MSRHNNDRAPARVLLLVEDPSAGGAAGEALRPTDVTETDPALVRGLGETVDICIVSGDRFDEAAAEITERREAVGAARAPCLVLQSDTEVAEYDLGPDGVADDLLSPSAPTMVLRARIDGLLRRRELARELDQDRTFFDRLAGRLAHDFRSDITAATGYLDIARETGDAAHFDKATTAIDRMADTLDYVTLLVSYAQTSPDPDDVELGDAVGAARQAADLTAVSLSPPSTLVTIRADPDWLVTLIRAVASVGNADTAAGRGDEDTAAASRAMTVTPTPDSPGFMIEDQGASEDVYAPLEDPTPLNNDAKHAFRFALAREVIEKHGWSVTVTAAEEGTRITILTGN